MTRSQQDIEYSLRVQAISMAVKEPGYETPVNKSDRFLLVKVSVQSLASKFSANLDRSNLISNAKTHDRSFPPRGARHRYGSGARSPLMPSAWS